ncbi:MAG: tetratricopeptide repeat-containing sensor histidine kinase [Bacteroidota bacterium]
MTKSNRLHIFFALILCTVLHFAGFAAPDTKAQIDEKAKIDSLNNLAFSQKRFDVARALNNLFNAENLAVAASYQKGLAITYLTEGGIFNQIGYNTRALSTYYKALQLFKTLKDTLNTAKTNQQIALSLQLSGRKNEAIDLYIESLKVYTDLNEKNEIANIKNSLGAIALDSNALVDAEQLFKDALAISISNGYTYGEKKSYYNLGLLEEHKRDYKAAESYYKKSITKDSLLKDRYGMALNFLQLASIRKKQNMVDASIDMANEAYRNAAMVPAFNLLRDAAAHITTIYRERNDIIKAAQWQDSLVKVLKVQIENEKEYANNFIDVIKNQEANNTNAENEVKRQRQVQKEQLLIITVGTFILIIVAVLAVLALVNYQRQRFFGKELKQKNEIIEKNSASLDQLNKEISHQNQLLETDNKTKNKLLSIISHDLRTPLVNTKGVLNLVNQGMVPPEEADRLLQLLETQYLGTTSLLDNLLFWIKGQMEGKEDDKVKVGLYHLMKTLEEEHRLPLVKKKIELRNVIDRDLSIITEKEMIRIVLRNLISNAIKFTNENGLIELSSRIEDGHVLYLTVKDSGIGMTKADIEKVNAKQYYNTTGTSYEKGSGFGLMLCRDLITKAGGELIIESEPGKGSSFTIRMPYSVD